MQAIVRKELRENIKLLPVGLLLIGFCVFWVTPRALTYTTSVSFDLMAMSSIGAGFFAVVLAAAQAWFDLSPNQRGFLFHRPVSRSQILYGKVIAAAIIYAIACVVPLACVGWWFAYSGPTYLPVRPIQVLPAFILCTFCFVLHPVTMFTIEREASWPGTKLLPLIGATCALFLLAMATSIIQEAWYPIVVVGAILCALFASLTLISTHPSRRWVVGLGAFALVIVCESFAGTFLEQLAQNSATRASHSSKLAVDQQGGLWIYYYDSHVLGTSYSGVEKPLTGDQLRPNQKPDLERPLPQDFAPAELSSLVDVRPNSGSDPYIRSIGGTASGQHMWADSRGMILVYELQQKPPFQGTLTRSGFHRGGEPIGEVFTSTPKMLRFPVGTSVLENAIATSTSLWVDADGVYQLDDQTAKLETLIKLPTERAAILLPSLEVGYKLLLQSAGKLHVFALESNSGSGNWIEAIQKQSTASNVASVTVPKLKATEIHVYPALPDERSAAYTSFGLTNSGTLVAVTSWMRQNFYGAVSSDENASWELVPYTSPWSQPQPPPAVIGVIASMPIGLLLFVFSIGAIAELARGQGWSAIAEQLPWGIGSALPLFWLAMLMTTVVSLALSLYICKRRGLSWSTTFKWTLATVLLGLAGPLTIVALYPRMAFESCPRCHRSRRVDHAKCEHCASPWEPLPVEGIEILDRTPNLVRV